MNWRRLLTTFLSTTVLVFTATLLAPPTSVNSSIVPLKRMNKTILEKVQSQKYLNLVLQRLQRRKNSSSSSSSSTSSSSSSAFPASSSSSSSSSIPHSMPSSAQEKSSATKDPMTRMTFGVVEKNVLTFRFTSEALQNSTQIKYVHLYLYMLTKERKRKFSSSSASPSTRNMNDNKRRKRQRGKTVKIRVFMSDESGSRGRRLAVLKRRITSSGYKKLSLPVSLMKNLGDVGANNTLRLRVQCKRCTSKTQMVLPGNQDFKRCARQRQRRMRRRRKKHKKRMRRWHCPQTREYQSKYPFIVTEEKFETTSTRYKRASGTQISSNEAATIGCRQPVISHSDSLSSNSSANEDNQCCRPIKKHVFFSDMNLDHIIVSPSGFEQITCTGMCSDASISQAKQDNQNNVNNPITSHQTLRFHQKQKLSRQPLLTSQVSKISQPTRRRHHHHHHHHYLRNRRGQWRNHKWSRLKPQSSCQPVETRDLVILHFTPDHRLVQSKLQNFLVTKCGCQGHSPVIKDSEEF